MSIFNIAMIAQLQFYAAIIFRLILACVLGGVIGYEREHTNRPAGFRTHILVCVGSALVMVTSEFIFRRYSGISNIDPARLGAQVISGIGFLGAGTIIREGFSVKGLTTAASLWAVSCVGIAVGIGFHEGAIAATLLIYITLITLKKLEDSFSRKIQYRGIYIESKDIPGQIGAIGSVFGRYKINIKKIDISSGEKDQSIRIKLLLRYPEGLKKEEVISDLKAIEGIDKITED